MHEGIMLCPNMTYPMFDSFILKFWQLSIILLVLLNSPSFFLNYCLYIW
jgi:hypothetical protein